MVGRRRRRGGHGLRGGGDDGVVFCLQSLDDPRSRGTWDSESLAPHVASTRPNGSCFQPLKTQGSRFWASSKGKNEIDMASRSARFDRH